MLADKYVPMQWTHAANIQNKYGMTPAMLILNGLPSDMCHDPTLRDIDGMTVAMHLIRANKQVPKEWIHDSSLMDH